MLNASVILFNYLCVDLYDVGGVANTRGRLVEVSSSVSKYRYPQYDVMGQVTSSEQIIDNQAYRMSYEYDYVGNLRKATYTKLQ